LCGKKARSWRRKAVVTRASARSCRCRMRTRSEVCKCEEVGSGLGQTKSLKLQRPFGRRITQGGDADAARKPPFDGGLDQSRRDECHRYRHVDLANAALLARGNGFDAGSATDDLVEPGTSARDGFDQCRTSLRLHWPRARSCGRGWKQDLLEPLGRAELGFAAAVLLRAKYSLSALLTTASMSGAGTRTIAPIGGVASPRR